MKTEQATIYLADDDSKWISKEDAAKRNLGIYFETLVAEAKKLDRPNPWGTVDILAPYVTNSSSFREAVIKYHKEISE
jgi:hypothetical protein